MSIRIALMLTGILVVTSSCGAQAALQPMDPAHAPVAAVDRFSDKAGTLLRRSTDKRLPAPNEPIDFDTAPLDTLGLSPTGEPVLYYHLDVQSTTPAPVYVLYREGENSPVQNQLDIIDTLPGEKGYNDFGQIWKVWVPSDYVANTITDASTLLQAGGARQVARAGSPQRREPPTARCLVSRPSRKILALRRGTLIGVRRQGSSLADLRWLHDQSGATGRRDGFLHRSQFQADS